VEASDEKMEVVDGSVREHSLFSSTIYKTDLYVHEQESRNFNYDYFN